MLTTEDGPKRHIYSWKPHSVGGTQARFGHPGRCINSKAWHLSSRPQHWRNTVSLRHTRVLQNPLAWIVLSSACQWISDLCFRNEKTLQIDSMLRGWGSRDKREGDSRPEIRASAQVFVMNVKQVSCWGAAVPEVSDGHGKVLTPAPPIVVVPLTILISDASRLGHKEGSVQPVGVLFWFSGLLSGSQNLWSPSDPQSQHVHTPLALQRWRGWTLLSQIGWTVTFMAHHSWRGELQWAVGFVHMFYTGLLHAGDQGLSLL